MRFRIYGGLTLALVVAGGAAWTRMPVAPQSPNGVFGEPTKPAPATGKTTYIVRSGDNAGTLLERYGFPSKTLLLAAEGVYDLAQIRAGRTFTFGYTAEVPHGTMVRYAIDEDRWLVLNLAGDAWAAKIEEIVYETRTISRRLSSKPTFWNAALDAGIRPNDFMRLPDEIFQWEIDFNTEIRAGASIVIVAEGLFYQNELKKLGKIWGAVLSNAGKETWAIRHEHPDKTIDYYGPDGKARKRPFLRSPLKFSRVTSGFNPRRYHPVLKRRRPHNGTDFGAPTGTGVRTVGDGAVVFAGRNGGHGNQVRVRHRTGHETGYSHLSRILVNRGQTVKQGETIGKVGATGLATGPHLHYSMKIGGKFIDPMRSKLPTTEPLPKRELPAFESTRDKWRPKLQAALDEATSSE
jgi:murein DD-endopeptidase MepM/ murein hydrolase activator NlpD